MSDEPDEEVVELSAGGQPSEVSRSRVVMIDLALRAAREFLENGARPDALEWQEL
ncbi:MAG: Imm1 family immunity protein [Acidobacteriota bacterium]